MTELAQRLRQRAEAEGFTMSSAPQDGRLLAALAAAKPGGAFLELGTGAGLGTVSLLSGMDPAARLVTVELSETLSRTAREEIADPRVEWVVADGGDWLTAAAARGDRYDLVFADTWPGKFTHLDEALSLVAPGGFFVVDDLLPVPTWTSAHQADVDALTARLGSLPGWHSFRANEGSGVLVCTRAVSPPG
jgi:predicted O-methyltransferase YrrM